MSNRDSKRLIVKPNVIEELVHHDIAKMEKATGPLIKFMDGSMVDEADVTVLFRKIEGDVSEDSEIGPSLHDHDVNQLYCLLDEFKLEVTIGEEKQMVEGPASILIPAGTRHAIRFAGGTGYLVNILSKGEYG